MAATALAACARLGARTVLVSLLGQDATGDLIVQGLLEEGIDTAGIRRTAGAGSPFSFVHVEQGTGERTIFHRAATGLRWTGGDLSAIRSWHAMLLDDYYPELARAAAAEARDSGVPIIADTQPKPGNLDLLRSVDVLIAPSHFLRVSGVDGDVDKGLARIHEAGPRVAVITLGGDGWVASDPAGRYEGKGFAVNVVDTLGAGDVFHGAFAYAIARQWPTPRCAEFASAVAALKCTHLGGRTGIPNLDATLAFLRQRAGNEWNQDRLT